VVHDVAVEAPTDNRIEEVYRAEAHRLRQALVAFGRDVDLANDAVSDAFAQAIARGKAIRDPTRWIWRAAFHIARGELKRRSDERGSPIDAKPRPEFDDRSEELLAALGKLPPKQRAAIVLFYLVDLPTKEVAKRLGVTETTVRVHLNHGRARLRALLEDHDD
jgi:RNA polymerase sigma-70 factor (ECF subfamily)